MNDEFITHDFKLPNHTNELLKANDVIKKLKKKIDRLKINNVLDNKLHDSLYEEIVHILDYVGKLSMPVFAIEDEMEQMYIKQYIHAPKLGRKLWLDNYDNVHHPYTLLKNRCFKLLDDLDELYIALYKKNPPNWNY